MILLGFLFVLNTAFADPVVALRLPHEPASLDWTLGDVPIHVINNTVEGLYRLDATGRILAEEAEAMPAPVQQSMGSWRIRLKPGLKWSDGRAVSAADYEAAW